MIEQQLREAMRAAGIETDDPIIADGELHRVHVNGDKPRSQNGWYVLHANGVAAAAFGCWKRGISETWCAKTQDKLTDAEREEYKRKIKQAQAQREAELAKLRAEAAKRAAKLWHMGDEPPPDHVYLAEKQVKAFGIRALRGVLMVPLRDASGTLHSLQFINGAGEKRFLEHGSVSGCYHLIGEPSRVPCIAETEGYATGATIHQATGYAVAVAFYDGNLKPVARPLKGEYPSAEFVVCADSDRWTEGNPGLTKARDAARAIGARLAVPEFADLSNKPTDFNDLARLEGLEAVRRQIEFSVVDDGVLYRCLADVEPKPIHWLWPGRIARGKVSLIAGHPGLGKSQLLVSLAAVVSKGEGWPVDGTAAERGSVVFLSAEDDAEDTVRPRLEAAGADLSRIYILDAVREHEANGQAFSRTFNLKTDLTRLDALLTKLRDVALVDIDPVSAYLGNVDKNAEVRALLAPLSTLAAKHDVAIVCISHFNKGGGSEALLRVTGSLAFVAAARAAYVVAKDNQNETRRLFLPIKNNLGNDRTGLAFAIQAYRLIETCGIETSRVIWEAEPVTVTADEVMATNTGDKSEDTAKKEAADWLRDTLKDISGVDGKSIKDMARAAGIAERTLYRAASEVGVKTLPNGFSQGRLWHLCSMSAKECHVCQAKNVGTAGKFGTHDDPEAYRRASRGE
jgi:putative DNA primase/helicase